jgi:hypothetical protein
MILEAVAWVTVEVVDVIAHLLLLIAQITVTQVTMTLVPVTHHTTERITTAMARVPSMMMLVTLAVTHQGGKTMTATRWTVKQRRQKGNKKAAAVPSYEVNCASFHKYDIQTVVF